MERVNLRLVVAACVGVLLISLPARAETILAPWLGANTGNRSASGVVDFGATAGVTLGGVIGVDVDLGYSPDFFGRNLNGRVLTTMGNVTIGIPYGGSRAPGIRPYVTGGLGLIRVRIENPLYGYSVAKYDTGINLGGGVMAFVSSHLGVRAELRYLRSLDDDNATNPFNPIDLNRLHYWRTSFGLVLR